MALEFEVVSDEARLKLTRLIRHFCANAEIGSIDGNIWVSRANQFVNIAHQVMKLPVYALKADDWGNYLFYEYDWHSGRIELIMREPSTPELVEILCDLIENELLTASSVDAILEADGASFSVAREYGTFQLNIKDINSIEEPEEDEHPNIRKLVSRMDKAISDADDPLVLHTSASIFETLAKIVMPDRKYQGKTLGDIIKAYRTQTALPAEFIEYIDNVYISRGREPLAGHGSSKAPTISHSDAVTLCEITKAIVRIERELTPRRAAVELPQSVSSTPDSVAGPLPGQPVQMVEAEPVQQKSGP